MKNVIKKVPIPLAGLILAFATVGNLVQSYGAVYRNIFGSIAALLLLLLLIKLVTYPKDIIEHLQNPIVASVSPTFAMGLMILSTYLKPYFPKAAFGMWVMGLILNIILIIYFTKKFIFNFNIQRLFPSYFIVYVGIVAASVTAPAYNQNSIGQAVFWFGFVLYLLLLPIVIYRVFVVKSIPEPAMPTIAIMAAPASLCLTGYLACFQAKDFSIVVFLGILSFIMFLGVLLYLPKLLKLKFYPSFSSFTFPLAISAVAMKQTNAYLLKLHKTLYLLNYIVKFQEILTIVIILYVLIKYLQFLFIE
ncbi:TDT family transporter [Candidatus Clostridium radicumherbarum]|uniref:TDT family transporter n=1 Tax=Candidatus Clostridium radicumherbarum TaxID=3381662 RepID=A0ABW8TY11_9CLOT